MSKRLTDSEKWKKNFIRSMKAPYKLLWLYILDECDHAGIWQVDIDVAEIKIGEKLDIKRAIESFGNRIFVFSEGEKWFIPDFIFFQYGVLDPKNRVHLSVLNILGKYNIDPNKPIENNNSPDPNPRPEVKKVEEVKKKEESREIYFPWETESFKEAWGIWKRYKKEQYKFNYKPLSEQAALKKISEFTSDEKIAIKIIHQSIENGWKGFFELNNNNNGTGVTKTGQRFDRNSVEKGIEKHFPDR